MEGIIIRIIISSIPASLVLVTCTLSIEKTRITKNVNVKLLCLNFKTLNLVWSRSTLISNDVIAVDCPKENDQSKGKITVMYDFLLKTNKQNTLYS